MTLRKKWIFISLLNTFLCADNNEINSSNETDIFTSIGNFFTQVNIESNTSKDENNSNMVNNNASMPENNEANSSNETDIFTSISNFFTQVNTESNTTKDENNSSIINNKSILENNETNSSEINNDINNFTGAWHLRILDGKEVRKARAILNFTFSDSKAKLSGFDGCNRISGNLEQKPQAQYTARLISTRMGCRGKIQRHVSKKLHETVSGGFSIKKEKKHGIEGMTIKSSKHELFFKRMERRSDWF